jgi:tRNA nucleotidyltransferase (CCA-adding enzyme)
MLLGRVPRECDYAFSGSPEAFVQANPSARKVGRSVNVFLLDGQEFMPLQGGRPDTDVLSRDLTVNALVLDTDFPPDSPDGVFGRLRAHPLALADLRQHILRAASAHAFSRDPARIFRLARFAAAFDGWSLDPATLEQARNVAAGGGLEPLPAERVCRELLKALTAPRPGRFLETLRDCGALFPWFEELGGADAVPAGPPAWHAHSVLGHTVAVMNRVAGDPLAVWLALCHDLGKVRTEAEILPHHYGHEERGVQAADDLSRRLGMPARLRRAGMLAARLHMKGGRYGRLRNATRCDLLCQVHQAHMHDAFWSMVEADSGCALRAAVDGDLAALLAVRLPGRWLGRGAESGARLRELRCLALAARNRQAASG